MALNRYWSEAVRLLKPYTPGEQPVDLKKYIKLNTNENPYGPSPKVVDAVKRAAGDSLRLYPDPECRMLVNAASGYYGVGRDQVFAGNGSDEVLAFAFKAFFDPGRPILFPDITYTFYPVYASLYNLDYRLVRVLDDYTIRPEDFFNSPGGVIIANPNAPTGKYMPLESVIRILDNNKPAVVIVDEAYIDFGGESAVGLIDRYPNLLVINTFSKSRALAGMRIGFALGNSELIDAVNRVKNSFNSYTMDRLAIIAGTEAFRDNDYFVKTRDMVVATRERITSELRKMDFVVADSVANFIFVSHPKVDAYTIYSELKAQGILVRYFNKPRIENCLRISIGTDAEMDRLIRELDRIMIYMR